MIGKIRQIFAGGHALRLGVRKKKLPASLETTMPDAAKIAWTGGVEPVDKAETKEMSQADEQTAAGTAAAHAEEQPVAAQTANGLQGIEGLLRSIGEKRENKAPPLPGASESVKTCIPVPEGQPLETYLVNEPFAYISISNTSPPKYNVNEAPLTAGEQALLVELRTRLFETLDVPYTEIGETAGFLRERAGAIIRDFKITLDPESMDRIMYYIVRDFIGYGKLDAILKDKSIEDISADGPGICIYVYHRKYGSMETNVIFDHDELDAVIYKMAQRSGRHISLANPLLDASLPTKDRLQLTIGNEITTRGSTLTIRKFRETPFTPMDLINFGTISPEMAAYFWMAMENGSNILFAGGTASGKTSILNAIAMFIPQNSKIVSIEDTREVNLLHQNWIPGVTRTGTQAHKIEMFDLLRSALRQRPEYILVGEVRGIEAYTLFQAMATGHFTLSTFHGDSVESVVRRLTRAPIDVPLMLLDSLDMIVLLGMMKVGDRRVRRVTAIMEVVGVDYDNQTLFSNPVFTWQPDQFTFSGESKLFEKIMRKLNMNEQELSREFSRRLEIIKSLKEQKINDFKTLGEIFFGFSVNPDNIEKMVKEGKIC